MEGERRQKDIFLCLTNSAFECGVVFWNISLSDYHGIGKTRCLVVVFLTMDVVFFFCSYGFALLLLWCRHMSEFLKILVFGSLFIVFFNPSLIYCSCGVIFEMSFSITL